MRNKSTGIPLDLSILADINSCVVGRWGRGYAFISPKGRHGVWAQGMIFRPFVLCTCRCLPPGGGVGRGQPQGISTFLVATDQIPVPRETPSSRNAHPVAGFCMKCNSMN